jgi:hypothetical protein
MVHWLVYYTYVVWSKRFLPDIQKLHQMENVSRCIYSTLEGHRVTGSQM